MLRAIFLIGGIVIVGIIVYVAAAFVVITRQIAQYDQYWQRLIEQSDMNAEVRYFALGDSAAQGVGASAARKGYVGILAAEIKKELPSVAIINLSKSGAKTSNVIQEQLPSLMTYNPTQNDIITLEIGANNIKTFNEETFTAEMTEILDNVPLQTIVADIPYFGTGRARMSEETANKASRIIRDLAEDRNLRIAQLEKITTENDSIKNYAIDLFHPSDRAYRLWAESFMPFAQSDIADIRARLRS